jgi:hypothetical protein
LANFFDQFDNSQPVAKSPYADAISSIESGGNYKAVGPNTGKMGRALGKYQVMSENVRPWSREVLGREITPQEFMSSPELQDAIFNGKFGKYVEKYGPDGAARAWFAGEAGMKNPNARDVLGTSVSEYSRRFNKAIGPQDATAAVQQFAPEAPAVMAFADTQPKQAQAKNFFDQFDNPASQSSGNAFDQFDAPAEQPIDAARAQLAKGLREGRNNDGEIYRAAAFRTNQGVPAAGPTEAAVSGATGGFSDEISAATRAPIDMATRGEGFDEAYQHNLAAERDRLDQYRKASPIASTASELAGTMAVPVSKAAGAIRTGLTQGALFGAGNSEGDSVQRASDAAVGAGTGAALSGVVAGIGRAVAGKAPSIAPSIEELKAAAKKGYQSEAIQGLEVNPAAVSGVAAGIRAKMDEVGFDEVIGTKAHAILKRLESVPEGATVTGRNLHSLQKALGKAAGSIDPQEKAAASMALRELNEALESLPAAAVRKGSADDFASAMREANANYSRAMQASNIDNKIITAETRAAAANSGMNVANTIRQRMADVKLNPKQNRGMHPDDVAAAGKIAEGTTTGNLVRKIGNMAGGGGGMGTLVSGAIGVGAAGAASDNPTLGLALPAFGLAMRGIGNRMTLNQAHKLSEAIRSRAPLASATTKFEEKVAQFHADRSTKTAAAAALAARNLATNLRGSGFNVSAGDLMRSLQGPVTSRAEDQPERPGPSGQ